LKYVFLAGKIIRTARSLIMKFSAKYPNKDTYYSRTEFMAPRQWASG